MTSRLTRMASAVRTCKWVVLLSTFVVAGSVGVAERLWPRWYESKAVIAITPAQVSPDYVRPINIVSLHDRLPMIQNQVLSRRRLESLLDDLELYSSKVNFYQQAVLRGLDIEAIVHEMRKNIHLEMIGDDVLRVSFVDRDPRVARKIADRVSSLIMEEGMRDREVLVEGWYQFLDVQISETKQRLVDYEQRIEQMQASATGRRPSQIPVIEYEALQGLYRQLLAKRHEVSIATDLERRQGGQNFKLIDQARLPIRALGPSWLMVTGLGALGGLSLGLVLVAALPRRKEQVQQGQQVQRVQGTN